MRRYFCAMTAGILKSLPPAMAVAEDTAATRAIFSVMVVSDGHFELVSQVQLGKAEKQCGHTHSTIGMQRIRESSAIGRPPRTSTSQSILKDTCRSSHNQHRTATASNAAPQWPDRENQPTQEEDIPAQKVPLTGSNPQNRTETQSNTLPPCHRPPTRRRKQRVSWTRAHANARAWRLGSRKCCHLILQ